MGCWLRLPATMMCVYDTAGLLETEDRLCWWEWEQKGGEKCER